MIFIILCVYNIGFCDSETQLYGEIQKSINDYEIGSRRFINKNRNIYRGTYDKENYPNNYNTHSVYFGQEECYAPRGGEKIKINKKVYQKLKNIAYEQNLYHHKLPNESSILNDHKIREFFIYSILIQLKENQENIIFGDTKEDFSEEIRDKVFPFLYPVRIKNEIQINDKASNGFFNTLFFSSNFSNIGHSLTNKYVIIDYTKTKKFFKNQTNIEINKSENIINFQDIPSQWFARNFVDFANYVECVTKKE